MKQEIIADLSRITEEEQAILDGKTEVEKERYSSGQKFVMDAGKEYLSESEKKKYIAYLH